MKLSVEISMYPLDKNFGGHILNFIKRIKSHPNISSKTNSMSTQIFGEYDEVMSVLQKEMKPIFADEIKTVMVMKFINEDLDYNFE
ncbi:MAG: YkoF family thiamine/hydroxymethylpyrimidine-binding protein [Saprospiraceae bacterium]